MRKKIFFTLTPSLFVCLAALLMSNCGGTSETSAGSAAPTFAISGVNLWDGAGNAPIRDGVIVVSDGRIQAVGPRVNAWFDRPWKPGEPRETALVVIGESPLDHDAIRQSLMRASRIAA